MDIYRNSLTTAYSLYDEPKSNSDSNNNNTTSSTTSIITPKPNNSNDDNNNKNNNNNKITNNNNNNTNKNKITPLGMDLETNLSLLSAVLVNYYTTKGKLAWHRDRLKGLTVEEQNYITSPIVSFSFGDQGVFGYSDFQGGKVYSNLVNQSINQSINKFKPINNFSSPV